MKKQEKIRNKTVPKQISIKTKASFLSRFELILIGLVFVLYGNTLFHDYALDDAMVISQNAFTKKGFAGIGDILTNDSFLGFSKEMLGDTEMKNFVQGGRYRPLSLVSFAVEYALFGKNTFVNHLLNIIFYALTAVLLYRLLCKLFPSKEIGNNFIEHVPLVASLLFVIHPLHTEVIANTKGRDEILAFLFSILAWKSSLVFVESKNKIKIVKSSVFLFLALLSKESAIAFVFVIPFSVYLFFKHEFKKAIILFAAILLTSILFVLIRQAIVLTPTESSVGGLMNNPFENVALLDRIATAFYTFLNYYQLLIFPHPLTYDYYPHHIAIHTFSSGLVIFSVLLTSLLFVVACFYFNKKKIIAFGILFFFGTFFLLSNIPVNIGALMGERFLYVPSLGFCLLAAYFISQQVLKIKVLKPFFLLVCVLFSIKTISRNAAWKNNKTLFETDVKTSYNSAHVNKNLGETYMLEAAKISDNNLKQQKYNAAARHLKKAVGIYPDYYDAWVSLGNVYYYQAKYDSCLSTYYISIKLNADKSVRMYKAIADVYGLNLGNYPKAIVYFKKALKYEPNSVQLYTNISIAYYRLKDFANAIVYTKKVLQLEPTNTEAQNNLKVFENEYLIANKNE